MPAVIYTITGKSLIVGDVSQDSDMTHLEDPDVVGTSSCVLFPTFLSRGAHDV